MRDTDKHNEQQASNTPHNVFASRLAMSPDMAPKTNGEKNYDRFIGLSTYLTTFAASLGTAFYFERVPKGQEQLGKLEGWLEKKIIPQLVKGKSPEEIKGNAHYLAKVIALMSGGTTPVIPFKIFEDGRIDRINAYNEKHGTGIDDPELIALAQERIDNLPNQSWTSALAGRGVAMASVLALSGMFGKQLDRYQDWATEEVLDLASNNGKIFQHKPGDFPTWLTEKFVMDGAWSAFTSAELLAFSRLSARLFGNHDRGKGYIDPYTPIEVDITPYQSKKPTSEKEDVPVSQEAAIPEHAVIGAQHQGKAAECSTELIR